MTTLGLKAAGGLEIKRCSQDPQHACYFKHAGTRAVIKGDWKIVREALRKEFGPCTTSRGKKLR